MASQNTSLNLFQANNTLTDIERAQIWFDEIVAKVNLSSMLFGIFGNLICVGVLAHKKMLKKRFHLYLLALAFSDLFYCLTVFSNYAVFVFNPPDLLYEVSSFTCYFTDYIYKSFDATGVILTLIVSLDRTYAITRPIQFRNFFTLRFPKTIIIITTMMVFAIRSPDFFLSERQYDLNNLESHCFTKKDKTMFLYNVICNMVLPFLLNFIPAVVILILNLTLWFYIVNYTKTSDQLSISTNRRRISNSQKSHYMTIIIIGIWLLLTTIPYYLFCTYYWFMNLQKNFQGTSFILIMQGITSAFFNMNHCLNFVIYLLFHQDFREGFFGYLIKLFNLVLCLNLNVNMCTVQTPDRRNNQTKISKKTKKQYFKAAQEISNMSLSEL